MKINNCKFHDDDYCKLRIGNKVLERCEKSNCILYRTKKVAKEVDAMTKREMEVLDKEARRNKKKSEYKPLNENFIALKSNVPAVPL